MRSTRITMVGLALLAALALSAVASATASAALPEQSPTSGTFTISSGAGTFETLKKESVKCTKDKGTGEITGAKTDKSKITFEGCTGPFGVKCNSTGEAAGNIKIEINSEVVYLNKATKSTGEKLALASEVEIKCTALATLKVRGATLCPVTPINTKATVFTITCKQTSGKQEFREYENEKGEKVKAITETSKNGGAFEESGLQDTDTLTFAAESEIKA